jgi:predicted aldo/keto reductase-like oxidoreductase
MSSILQVEQNLAFAEDSRIGYFSPEETELIAEVRQKYMARTIIPCTRCGYCMPCPNGVDIPGNIELFNYAHTHNDLMSAKFRFKVLLTESQRASNCTSCGSCEPLCPQKLEIPQWMAKVSVQLS